MRLYLRACRFDSAARATYAQFLPGGDMVTARHSPSVEMLRRLIAFPTVSRDSNLELIHYLRDCLK
ncbi:MAG: hypothetical protein ACREUP_01850, partial [Burkholderiales bacterium]